MYIITNKLHETGLIQILNKRRLQFSTTFTMTCISVAWSAQRCPDVYVSVDY